ncbi:UDP-GlcNAc:betaGal beta-1,3-N-acetylglucosaminyltransferase-like protein 1 isoform X3 [Panthera tigris]|uniref:UDP-GlcNAc:betaGal beta-1,3-N-acetylglucosaminyltransferase-like protein 1 isoform X3 n=2 Tax=Panthera tigris TaxID=9694 RepID=UPI001C6F78DC|nr:UDP-GlcNAc:betaGal beta-1,3-N-acetylglucosaminyltransferase-like protein 1 isoform X3 [Panthera tigris]
MEVCAGLTTDTYVVSPDQRLGTELDDVMMPQRVRLQLEAAAQHPTSIVGCQVRRDPPNSTERYTRWINQLAPDQLLTQVFTSNGPTVIMPTWFCSRAWFSHVGPFDEGGQGEPEDLLFFYSHLRKGGGVIRVDQSLLLYRYHPNAATHSVLETTIWTHRVRFLEERALPHWATFTIWNAGRQGRRLYRSLTAGMRRKVVAFCDVDENKIRKGFYCHEDSQVRGAQEPLQGGPGSHTGHHPYPARKQSSQCAEPSSPGKAACSHKAARPSTGEPISWATRAPETSVPAWPVLPLEGTSGPDSGEGCGAATGAHVWRVRASRRPAQSRAHDASPPSGKAEASGSDPALPSCTAALRHLREAGECQPWLGSTDDGVAGTRPQLWDQDV